jgi:hypothetical protein
MKSTRPTPDATPPPKKRKKKRKYKNGWRVGTEQDWREVMRWGREEMGEEGI